MVVQNHLNSKDIATVGMAALNNLIARLEAIKADLSAGKKTSFNKIEDLLDTYQSVSQTATTQAPSLTSSIFYVDFKGNLDVIKTFLNTGVMSSYTSKFTELSNLVNIFDKDRNGSFNDAEVINGMMDYYTGKVSVSDPALLDIIFASNSNYNDIKAFLRLADTNGNNNVSKDEFVSLYYSLNKSANATAKQKSFLTALGQYSDFRSAYNTLKAFDVNGDGVHSDVDILLGLLTQRKGNIVNPDQAIINSILASNPDGAGVLKLVKVIDPDANGEYHNVTDVLNHAIAIWQGSVGVTNLALDFNGDGVVNAADASTLFNLHMNIDNLAAFSIVH
jgi:Ca2+-binding EF-hand superfamily protein